MKKSTKVCLGIATIWPILYIFTFIAVIVLTLALVPENGPPGSDPSGPGSIWLPIGFLGLLAVHLLTALDVLALKVFYIVRVFKTEQLDQNMRLMWTLLLVFATILAEPVFWYLYIWREQPPAKLSTPRLPALAAQTAWSGQTTPDRDAAYVPPRQPPDWR